MLQIVRMQEPKHRLQHARAEAGYSSPTDAARKLKAINQNTLISHENGNRPLSRQAAEKYARLFNVRAGWLLYGENGSRPTPIDRLTRVLEKAADIPAELQERIVDFAEFEIDRYERDREIET